MTTRPEAAMTREQVLEEALRRIERGITAVRLDAALNEQPISPDVLEQVHKDVLAALASTRQEPAPAADAEYTARIAVIDAAVDSTDAIVKELREFGINVAEFRLAIQSEIKKAIHAAPIRSNGSDASCSRGRRPRQARRERRGKVSEIVARLSDLHKQATEERSHYYVGKCVRDAIATIRELEKQIGEMEAVIAWANNSLYGSHGFFLSTNGGPPNKHHLDEAIEKLKAQAGSEWRRAEAAEQALTAERQRREECEAALRLIQKRACLAMHHTFDETARDIAWIDDECRRILNRPSESDKVWFRVGDDHSYYGGPDYKCVTAEQCAELERRFADAERDIADNPPKVAGSQTSGEANGTA